MSNNLKPCPCCGALPIGWTGDPLDASGLIGELVDALELAEAHFAGEPFDPSARKCLAAARVALAKARGCGEANTFGPDWRETASLIDSICPAIAKARGDS